jgi:hypothetical protein
MRAGHICTVQQDSTNSPWLSTFHLITSVLEHVWSQIRQGDQLCRRIEIMNGAGAGARALAPAWRLRRNYLRSARISSKLWHRRRAWMFLEGILAIMPQVFHELTSTLKRFV